MDNSLLINHYGATNTQLAEYFGGKAMKFAEMTIADAKNSNLGVVDMLLLEQLIMDTIHSEFCLERVNRAISMKAQEEPEKPWYKEWNERRVAEKRNR